MLIEAQKFRSKTWKPDLHTKYPVINTRSHSPAQTLALTKPPCCYVMPADRNQPIPHPNRSKSGHTHYQTLCEASWKMSSGTGTGYPGDLWNISPSLEMFISCLDVVLGNQLCTALLEHRVGPDRSLPASIFLWFSCGFNTQRSVKMPGTGDMIKHVGLFFFPQRLKKEQFLQFFNLPPHAIWQSPEPGNEQQLLCLYHWLLLMDPTQAQVSIV